MLEFTPHAWTLVLPYYGEKLGLKKCILERENVGAKRPTKFMFILDAEVVLMIVWGAVCPNLWTINRLPYTFVILGQNEKTSFS